MQKDGKELRPTLVGVSGEERHSVMPPFYRTPLRVMSKNKSTCNYAYDG